MLNEIVAEIIRASSPGNHRLVEQALHALCMHNWAVRVRVRGRADRRETVQRLGCPNATRALESGKRADVALARMGGSQKAEHRRTGWQLLAAFQVDRRIGPRIVYSGGSGGSGNGVTTLALEAGGAGEW